MAKFKSVSSQVNFPELEENLINFWKKEKIFEKSIQEKPEDQEWTFLDGPPFVTGTPHYGSLLSSIPKDVFGRYWTMKGYRVRRVWGWDGHGLPIENKVELKLDIKRKRDIEEVVGVKKFIEECLGYVNSVSSEWEWYIDHIGRWVDFKNAYKTWDLPYMESVMWVFKQMYEKGLIYKGLRVSLYCPHCATPISNFEVAMDGEENYRDVTESSTTYKYKVKDEEDTYILAWSTTPWNKIATPVLAVNPALDYVKVSQGSEKYILAKDTLKMLKEGLPFKILEEFKGKDLEGLEFELHYDFYLKDKKPDEKAGVVVAGNFVTSDEGTGVVTIGAYGAEDLEVIQKEKVQLVLHVDDEGMIREDIPLFGGMYYLKTNEKVNEDLKKRNLIYDDKTYTHSMPHCWRCKTRLFYAPKDAWYVNVQKIKPRLFKNNESINWFPKHFKYGRFAKSMESAPDWNISRNRYWGSPIPVWQCQCGQKVVPGSIKELEDLSGRKITDLHKPYIDEIEIKCISCGKQAKRVSEVLDSWIEAGSASFAERHFPFSSEKLEDFFPPDFIAEYTGQIRAWFYVLHIIGTALFDSLAFKNVLVEGVMLGTDGRKMSKNYGNYPDPKEVMSKFGGDGLRLYLLGSPVMKGEDVNFSNEGVPDAVRGFMLILWNCYKYFVDYANAFGWNSESDGVKVSREFLTVLDRWILARLNELIFQVRENYEHYDTANIVKLLKEFAAGDLSTWYIRRSRDRISGDDLASKTTALSVLYEVLVTYSKLLAPVAPFLSEEIYKNLTSNFSVHLSSFPQGDKSLLDKKLIEDMRVLREIAEVGHSLRKEAEIKLRQPLSKIAYIGVEQLSLELEELLADELNVKSIEYKKSSPKKLKVELDTKITPLLAEEGLARDLMRQIQQLRKEQNLTLSDKTKIEVPVWPKNFEEAILKQTASISIVKGESLRVIKADSE